MDHWITGSCLLGNNTCDSQESSCISNRILEFRDGILSSFCYSCIENESKTWNTVPAELPEQGETDQVLGGLESGQASNPLPAQPVATPATMQANPRI